LNDHGKPAKNKGQSGTDANPMSAVSAPTTGDKSERRKKDEDAYRYSEEAARDSRFVE
jgi:hypothetical protein